MRFDLPGVTNRREILAAPELLRIEAEGMQLSKITKVLIMVLMTLLYFIFVGGSLYNIVTHQFHDTGGFIKVFAALFVMITGLYVAAALLIIKNNRSALIFTEVGIAGTALFSAKYENLGGYAWESSNGFLTTGQLSKKMKKTLFITANKGWFPETRYVTRFGTSGLGSHGYYFKPYQIQMVEEIMTSRGIKRLPDR